MSFHCKQKNSPPFSPFILNNKHFFETIFHFKACKIKGKKRTIRQCENRGFHFSLLLQNVECTANNTRKSKFGFIQL